MGRRIRINKKKLNICGSTQFVKKIQRVFFVCGIINTIHICTLYKRVSVYKVIKSESSGSGFYLF